MRILIVMDPGILVPPKGYGGIERIVDMMAREYRRAGHEVHLLVTTGSYVEGCIMHPFGKEGFPPKRSDASAAIPIAWKFLWKHRNYFDLIHNFGRLAYLIPVLHHPVRKIMSYQREISTRNIRLINLLKGKNIVFTACSGNLLSRLNTTGPWEVVYNAIEKEKYKLTEELPGDAPLIFLGRIEKVKGCHIAIEVAKATGNNLVIAGNISTLPEEKLYYEQEILPLIDGRQIKYLGVLNDEQKNEWLGKSKAMLFPIEWDEPFGIVMIEAMACGTPVIGIGRGSVPEVVEEGVTGFKVTTVQEMISAVNQVQNICRKACRNRAVERFDTAIIAARYLQINSPSRKKIVIVTTGQPAANPRVVKEYEALIGKGYNVKVIYTYSAPWSYHIDEKKFETGALKKQDFILAGGNGFTATTTYFLSRLLFKIIQKTEKIVPLPFLKSFALSRAAFPLWLSAAKHPADIYMAHYLGALPAAARAAKKTNACLVFDAEDFHRGEVVAQSEQAAKISNFENRMLPLANLITTASPLITEAYSNLYPKKNITTINNVFSKKFLQPLHENVNEPLSMFWFSQNLGPNRGLETIIGAFKFLGNRNISLHLLGNNRYPEHMEQLLSTLDDCTVVTIHPVVEPDEVFKIAAQFDIGLASEVPTFENRNICLTNKIFTYLLAGNCVLVSDTAAQKKFMDRYSDIGYLYQHNNAADMAAKIILLYDNRDMLNQCKRNALELANNELNWENERHKLYTVVENCIDTRVAE